MTLVRIYLNPSHLCYSHAKRLITHTIEKINQEHIILDHDQERVIIDSIEKFNQGEYLLPDLEVELNSIFAA